jgi:hypothetical protein
MLKLAMHVLLVALAKNLECWMLELAMYDLLVAYKQFGILDA